MMSILLTLFFMSLASITFMIGRKLSLVRNGQIEMAENPEAIVPDVHKLRHFTLRSFKKGVYLVTFLVLHVYVKSSNFTKKYYTVAKAKVQKAIKQHLANNITSRQETNKVLKVIAEYKKKISIMKNRIHEEEKI